MIAVKASTSPHSSESFTPFGSNARILEEPDSPAVFSSDAAHRLVFTTCDLNIQREGPDRSAAICRYDRD
jgi:hypothetical protein